MEIKEDLRYNHFYALNENNKNKQLDWSAKKDGQGVFLSNHKIKAPLFRF